MEKFGLPFVFELSAYAVKWVDSDVVVIVVDLGVRESRTFAGVPYSLNVGSPP